MFGEVNASVQLEQPRASMLKLKKAVVDYYMEMPVLIGNKDAQMRFSVSTISDEVLVVKLSISMPNVVHISSVVDLVIATLHSVLENS